MEEIKKKMIGNSIFDAIKIPTLKYKLIEIKTNPEQYLLTKIIGELEIAAANGRNSYIISNYTEDIKTYLEGEGLIIE